LGLNIPPSDLPIEEQIQNAFTRLNPSTTLYAEIIRTYKRVRSAKKYPVPRGKQLAWPSDEHNKYAPAGCTVNGVEVDYRQKGIILFHDKSNSMDIELSAIQADPDATYQLGLLPKQEQAAAWVHETIYKFLRETRFELDSVRARKIVGYLFSDMGSNQLNSVLEPFGLRPKTGPNHLEVNSDGSASYYVSYLDFNKFGPAFDYTPAPYTVLYYPVDLTVEAVEPLKQTNPKCKSVEKLFGKRATTSPLMTCDTNTSGCGNYNVEKYVDYSQAYIPFARGVEYRSCEYDYLVTDNQGHQARIRRGGKPMGFNENMKQYNLVTLVPSVEMSATALEEKQNEYFEHQGQDQAQ